MSFVRTSVYFIMYITWSWSLLALLARVDAEPVPQSGRPELGVQTGHSGAITQASLTQDGRFLVTTSTDGTILWDVKTGKQLFRYQQTARDRIQSAFGVVVLGLSVGVPKRITPPDSSLLIINEIKQVSIVETRTGKQIHTIKPQHANGLVVASFSRTGKFCVFTEMDYDDGKSHSSSFSSTVLEATTGRRLYSVASDRPFSSDEAFSPNDELFLTADNDGAVIIRDTRSWAQKYRLDGHDRFAKLLPNASFSPDGKYIASTGQSIHLWNVQTGEEMSGLFNNDAVSGTFNFSPDSVRLVTGGDKIRIWSLTEKRLISTLDTQQNVGFFTPNGNMLVTGTVKPTIQSHFWSIEQQKEVLTLPGTAFGFSSNGRQVFTKKFDATANLFFGSNGTVNAYDIMSGAKLLVFDGACENVVAMFVSPNGQNLLTFSAVPTGSRDKYNYVLQIKTVATGLQTFRFDDVGQLSNMLSSPDKRFLLLPTPGVLDKKMMLVSTDKGSMEFEFDGSTGVASNKYAVIGSDKPECDIYDIETHKIFRSLPGKPLAISETDKLVLTTDQETILYDIAKAKVVNRWGKLENPADAQLSADGQYLLTGDGQNSFKLTDTETGKLLRKLDGGTMFLPNGRSIISFPTNKPGWVFIHDVRTGNLIRSFNNPHLIGGGYISHDAKTMWTTSLDKIMRLFDLTNGQELCQYVGFENGGYAVFDTEGRFDTDNLENIQGLYWRMPDTPDRRIAPEIFMRQYFTPQLLKRILSGDTHLPKVKDVTKISRIQPSVSIISVKPDVKDPNTALVTVEASSVTGENGKSSGVYSLRLFRDGQLVGWMPEDDNNGGQVQLDIPSGKVSRTFAVRLPHDSTIRQIEFSAYAFNDEHVKSATDYRTYTLLHPLPAKTGRAYIISLGANVYQSSHLNRLSFAANDARIFQVALGERLAKTGQFSEVVRVPLLSDEVDVNGKPGSIRTATKANLRAVLDVLAGKDVDHKVLKWLPDGVALQKATPDDLLILTFACHGETDGTGNFYLFPYDIGGDANSTPAELYHHAISDGELSNWLRRVDAGYMAMIVDACHSAASVENGDFKPGPMGSRGLGQLSYDKGILILAASQADNVARESRGLRHGLLTFALIKDGLEDRHADWRPKDNKIDMVEWLEYAVQRVPVIDQTGNGRPAVAVNPPAKGFKPQNQQPSLFNFAKSIRWPWLDIF